MKNTTTGSAQQTFNLLVSKKNSDQNIGLQQISLLNQDQLIELYFMLVQHNVFLFAQEAKDHSWHIKISHCAGLALLALSIALYNANFFTLSTSSVALASVFKFAHVYFTCPYPKTVGDFNLANQTRHAMQRVAAQITPTINITKSSLASRCDKSIKELTTDVLCGDTNLKSMLLNEIESDKNAALNALTQFDLLNPITLGLFVSLLNFYVLPNTQILQQVYRFQLTMLFLFIGFHKNSTLKIKRKLINLCNFKLTLSPDTLTVNAKEKLTTIRQLYGHDDQTKTGTENETKNITNSCLLQACLSTYQMQHEKKCIPKTYFSHTNSFISTTHTAIYALFSLVSIDAFFGDTPLSVYAISCLYVMASQWMLDSIKCDVTSIKRQLTQLSNSIFEKINRPYAQLIAQRKSMSA